VPRLELILREAVLLEWLLARCLALAWWTG
jgi:hypothetical protein